MALGMKLALSIQVVILAVLVGDAVCDFQLTVLHTNDIHARVQEIDKYNGLCSQERSDKNECFGGYPRIKTMVDELRSKYPNNLLVDAGDQFQGSLWFYLYGGVIMSHFMNLVGYDAMGLGNHEFDNQPDGLTPFVKNANFSILSCNADMSKYPDLAARVKKSTIHEVNGQKVGVIGYTTTETPFISRPENIDFYPELKSIQAEADALTRQGVNKIIAVGHAGYSKDVELARNLRGVDVIVGGHTNSFLYTGTPPSVEDPMGKYPTVVTNPDGENVLIVQDYAYGKYLGNLQVNFDDAGTVTSWGGDPVLLDSKVAKDKKALQAVQSYLPAIQEKQNDVVGTSLVKLLGDRSVCRRFECNLGNLIADAMVHENLRESDGIEWSSVAVAIINSGSMRADIHKGKITMANVLDVQPFGNTVDIVEITGQTIMDVLEHCASHRLDVEDGWPGFLQVSGLRIVYDMSKDKGHRVVKVDILCTDCPIPEFKPLDKEKVYKVLMQSYLIDGNDGYSMIKDNVIKQHTIGNLDSDILLDYIKHYTPLSQGLDGRIRFVSDDTGNDEDQGETSSEMADSPTYSPGVENLCNALKEYDIAIGEKGGQRSVVNSWGRVLSKTQRVLRRRVARVLRIKLRSNDRKKGNGGGGRINRSSTTKRRGMKKQQSKKRGKKRTKRGSFAGKTDSQILKELLKREKYLIIK